jgi:hypothetical protein
MKTLPRRKILNENGNPPGFWLFMGIAVLMVVIVVGAFSGCKSAPKKASNEYTVKCVQSARVPFGSSICSPVTKKKGEVGAMAFGAKNCKCVCGE